LELLTEWSIFRNPDFGRIKSLLRTPVIVDGRNQYDPKMLRSLGFIYHGIGRK
jgi:UDPglucose 6-dehydrogenase